MTNRPSRRVSLSYLLLLGISTAPVQAQSGTLVVVNKNPSTADIIDLGSHEIVATLPTGSGPHEVAITGDGATAVITDYGANTAGRTLTVIDVDNRSVRRTIDLGEHRRPHGIAFLPGDSLVAVTCEGSRSVVLVRVADGSIVQAISTAPAGSHMLAIVGDGSRIYTSDGNTNTVSELDLLAGRVTRTFPVPPRPEAITVTADGAEVWVGSNDEGTVSVIDTRTGRIETAAADFGWPYRILIAPDNHFALVPDLQHHELRVLDRASHAEMHRFSFPDAGPQGITLSPDGKTAYHSMSREARVAVINLERMVVTGYIETSPTPDGVAIGPGLR